MSGKAFGWVVGLLVVACVIVVAGIGNGWFVKKAPFAMVGAATENAALTPERDPNEPPGSGYGRVGGIWRPIIDVEKKGANENADAYTSLPSFGASPLVPFETNKATQLIQEAIESEDESLQSRTSAMVPAKPFDRVAYEKDPSSYLDEVEPGRIWQTADEGEGVAPIGRLGDFHRQLLQGESAPLSVRVEPNMPATYYSPQLGQFENKLTSITVKANEKGIATATYTATPGTHGDVTVYVASPVASGQARFLFDVVVPETGLTQTK